jgi:hypothetical protein
MRFSLFKTPKPRTFNHQPIYYSEAKEEMKERQRRAKEDLGLLTEDEKTMGYESRIRGKMRTRIKQNFTNVSQEHKKSNTRLLLILVGLGVLAYLLLRNA